MTIFVCWRTTKSGRRRRRRREKWKENNKEEENRYSYLFYINIFINQSKSSIRTGVKLLITLDRIIFNSICSLNLRFVRDSASDTLYYVSRQKEGKKIYLQCKCFPEILYSEVVLTLCFHRRWNYNHSHWHINCHLSLWYIDLSITIIRLF